MCCWLSTFRFQWLSTFHFDHKAMVINIQIPMAALQVFYITKFPYQLNSFFVHLLFSFW